MAAPWTPERRALAAEVVRRVKPWLKSTGPRTEEGKAACFKNLPAWTDERRVKMAEITRQVQPWLKSTGPRTPEGKAVASQNAYKGDKRGQLRALHRKGRAILKDFDAACLELEKNGLDFAPPFLARPLTDEELLAVIAEYQAKTDS